jgi:hypothetical protein
VSASEPTAATEPPPLSRDLVGDSTDVDDDRPSSPYLLDCEVCRGPAAEDVWDARGRTGGWLRPLLCDRCSSGALLGLSGAL